MAWRATTDEEKGNAEWICRGEASILLITDSRISLSSQRSSVYPASEQTDHPEGCTSCVDCPLWGNTPEKSIHISIGKKLLITSPPSNYDLENGLIAAGIIEGGTGGCESRVWISRSEDIQAVILFGWDCAATLRRTADSPATPDRNGQPIGRFCPVRSRAGYS